LQKLQIFIKLQIVDVLHVVDVGGFVFEGFLPNLKQANSRMKPVEDSQGHGDVGDDGPGPVPTVELNLDGMRVGPVGLQGVQQPHGQVAH